MKNKKLFALFLCAALVFSLLASGCSPEKNSQESPPAEQDSSEPPAETGDSAGTAAALGSLKTFAAGTLDGGTFTQEDIAAAVSVSRVTVSRVLGEFSRAGWVTPGYRTISLLEPERLEELCKL